MTRDEQIEAMWEAFDKVANSGMWTRKAAMQAVLDAADVEGMVRLGAQMARDFHAESIDAIVQSVMEGGQ